MADTCIFCGIVSRQVPSDVVHETEKVLAFRDISPQAPHHILVIPKRHIATLEDLNIDDAALIGEMYLAAQQVARQEGFADDGYRTVINCGAHGHQTVYHLHLHVLGGRRMRWPPG